MIEETKPAPVGADRLAYRRPDQRLWAIETLSVPQFFGGGKLTLRRDRVSAWDNRGTAVTGVYLAGMSEPVLVDVHYEEFTRLMRVSGESCEGCT